MVDQEAQLMVLDLIGKHGSITKVANMLGINKGHVSRSKNFAVYSPTLREALGLHPHRFELVEICQECGKVHKQLKTCPNRVKKTERHRRHIEFSSKERAKKFDEMLLDYGYKTSTEFLNAILGSWINEQSEQDVAI